MSSSNEDDEYEVGHGKPPKRTQWKKGESGNPKGRPRRTKDIALVMQRIMDEPLPVNSSGQDQPSTQEALLRRQIVMAMAGNQQAFSIVMKQAQRCGLIVRPADRLADKPRGILLLPDPVSAEEFVERLAALRESQSKLSETTSPKVQKRFESTDQGEGEH